MPTPKEKPKGRVPKEKRGGFTPKEAGQIVREKYRQMAEQRQPEENEREYAADKLQSGLERGGAFASDLVGREKDALRKSITRSGNRQEPAPFSDSTSAGDTPDPAAEWESPGPEPGKRANAPKERPDPIRHTTAEHPDSPQSASPSAPKERAKQLVKASRTIPKERPTTSTTVIATPPEPQSQLDTVRPIHITPKVGGEPTPLMRPNLGRINAAKQELKLELAKERAGNRGRVEPKSTPVSATAPSGGQSKNAPTAQAVRTHDTDKIADIKSAMSHKKEKTKFSLSTAPKAPKAGRPTPGRNQARGRDTARPFTHPIQAMRRRLKRQAVKRAAQQKAQQLASHTAKTVARKGATVAVRIMKAVARAVAALFSTLAGFIGGSTLIAIVLVIAIAGALISSPFGILFSNQDHTPGVIPVSLAVGQINQAFSSYLDRLQSGGSYDSVEIHGAKADWVEVLAVFAVKTALYDGENAADVVTLDQERVNRLSAVSWDMNQVRTWVEAIYHPPVDEDDSGWTEYILHIYIEGKTAGDMKFFYGFTPAQAEALDELLKERELLNWLLSDLFISDETARDVLDKLPEELNPKRRAAVEKALSLVGKVGYFWGGKSYVIGWDDRWGQLTQVTSPGSSTTGTYLPFGLDCSGYLDWTFRNAGLQNDGHWYLETNLAEITWDEALAGGRCALPG